MAVHQVTPGCSKVGGVGNSSPSLSDSRYPADRFTPVLNVHPFNDYTLQGYCAWGRCEIMALRHVPKPCAVPVRLELFLQSGDKKAAQPPAASFASAGQSSRVLTIS